jgi:tRNA (guanine26-N2/guanine27-N2)-dimethyltransferase
MALDRDIGVAWAQAWTTLDPAPKRGWEMLAATGVRGLRLVNESSRFTGWLSTEANPAAAEALARNADRYGAKGARARCADAHHRPEEAPFDYVDLDPYGSPLAFLTDAFGALAPGGVLAVTATDMTVLAGVDAPACRRRYGGQPIRGRLGPEAGLRILLAKIAREAEALGRTIQPSLAYVGDHHVRAYVTVRPAPSGSERPVRTIDPAQWDGPALPPGSVYGPMWLGPLFDPEWIARMVLPASAAEPGLSASWILGWQQEVFADRPFYYETNELAHRLAASQPVAVETLIGALREKGFRAARTQTRAGAFRTTAPRSVVEGVVGELSRAGSHQKDRVRA